MAIDTCRFLSLFSHKSIFDFVSYVKQSDIFNLIHFINKAKATLTKID